MTQHSTGDIDPENVASTLLHEHGAPTVVLLHGMTATPRQFERFAPLVHASGRNVLVPLLPRHGFRDRMTTSLARLHANELTDALEAVVAEARSYGGSVTVAGFSLGGTLAAHAAQHCEIERAVGFAPFFGPRMLPPLLHRLAPHVLRPMRDRFVWWNPLKREKHGFGDGYPRYPLGAVREAMIVANELFESATHERPRARSIAFLTNPRETASSNSRVAALAQLWRNHGSVVDELSIEGLPSMHDYFTARTTSELADIAYPQALAALFGDAR